MDDTKNFWSGFQLRELACTLDAIVASWVTNQLFINLMARPITGPLVRGAECVLLGYVTFSLDPPLFAS